VSILASPVRDIRIEFETTDTRRSSSPPVAIFGAAKEKVFSMSPQSRNHSGAWNHHLK
jgi:hypothetical protein